MMALPNKQQLGKCAEKDACRFLEAKGFQLLLENYRCRFGEIDLIMKDQEDIVFVEVRSRSSIEYGTALESITRSKMNKLIKTATYFLQTKNWLYKVVSRFDVVTIDFIEGKMQLNWIKNAFWAE